MLGQGETAAVMTAREMTLKQSAQGSQQPREIGLLQRVEGVRGGLDEIHGRLLALAERISGNPPATASNATPPIPMGMPANLSASEDRIRGIMQLIGQFEQAF